MIITQHIIYFLLLKQVCEPRSHQTQGSVGLLSWVNLLFLVILTSMPAYISAWSAVGEMTA
jgi:hypothetical protein